MYLHYPKCFQQFSNPEKSVILIKVTDRFIWSPVNGVIPPLPKRTHAQDAYGGAVFVRYNGVYQRVTAARLTAPPGSPVVTKHHQRNTDF